MKVLTMFDNNIWAGMAGATRGPDSEEPWIRVDILFCDAIEFHKAANIIDNNTLLGATMIVDGMGLDAECDGTPTITVMTYPRDDELSILRQYHKTFHKWWDAVEVARGLDSVMTRRQLLALGFQEGA